MKKFFYLFFIVAAFLTLSISCSKAEQDTEIVKPSEEKTEPENATTIRFNMSLASEGGKATILSNGKVTWNTGDQVTVYAVNDEGVTRDMNTVAVSNISTDGITADIVTVLPAGCTYYAVFPADENATISDDVMTVSEPAADTPQTNYNCQVAVSKAVKQNGDYYLHFTNVNALIKFEVSSALASTVTTAELVSQTSGEAVSYDKVSYNFADSTSTCAGNEVASLTRTVVEGDNFIALAPGVSMSDGFCLKLKDSAGKVVKLFFLDNAYSTAGKRGKVSNISNFETRLYTNLSKDETANCYLINKADTIGCKLFCFDATVKGNGKVVSGLNSPHDSKDLSPNTVTKLWSTYNTRNTPEEGTNPPIVTSVTYHKAGYASFEYGRHGNVILAANNSDGIIWSWHLWLPDHNVHEVIHQKTSESKTMSHMYMLNANLGALYTSFDNYESFARDFGFYYQWGRKDPFVGTCIRNAPISDIPYCAVEGEPQNRIDTCLEADRLTYSIKHPTIFFRTREELRENTRYPRARDWFGSSSTAPVDLWKKTEKTVYDPCPPGYRVPVAGNIGPFKGFSNTAWDETKDGRSFINIDNETVWFPAAGFLHRCTGKYQTTSGYESFGVNGGYWCANNDDNFGPYYWQNTQSYYCYFDKSTCNYVKDDATSETAYTNGSEAPNAEGDNNAGRGTGRSVRCVKE